MTTESQKSPSPGLPGAVGLLLRAAAAALVVLAATVVVAGLVTGGTGVAGALTGGLAALVVFLVGSLVVDAVAGMAPGLSLVFALSTYTLQVLVLGLMFSALSRSDLMGSSLHAGWLGGSVIVVTVVWLAVQVVLTSRARIPAWDLGADQGPERAPALTHDLRHGAGER